MRIPFLAIVCALIGAGAFVHGTHAITYATGASPAVVKIASMTEDGTDGIRTWTRIVNLGGLEDLNKPVRTWFVPSDAAFDALPKEQVAALLAPGQRSLRRAFLMRAATDVLIVPGEINGRSFSITTLDGRPLTIDATHGEVTIGDAEALDVRTRADGSIVYVIDHPL